MAAWKPSDRPRRRVLPRWAPLLSAISAAFIIAVGAQLKQMCYHDCHLMDVTHRRTSSRPNLAVESELSPSLETSRANGAVKVAWLMSFPNSGTSFTSAMIRHRSQMVSASNYGVEVLDANGNSIPVYASPPGKPQMGPFWTDHPQDNYSRPTTFALTKTHCGGRCQRCGPKTYVETAQSFFEACLSGNIAQTTPNGTVISKDVQYDKDLVHRAVHLVRNPFDNVVSRFHHLMNKYKRGYGDVDKLAPSRSVFRTYCLEHNKLHEKRASEMMDSKAFKLLKNVPCRDDFFKYIQWHNLAFATTKSLAIPTMVVHYEQYSTHYNETATELMEFLDLKVKGELIDFVKGKVYIDFFTMKERKQVAKAMKILAESSTWEQISHYFGDTTVARLS